MNTGTIATLTNTGTISNGGAGADAIYSAGPQASIGLLSNSGQIDGAVDLLGGWGDTLDNFGQIFGNIALAGGDTLMNQGQVYGGVTLGSADTFDASSGEITGAITASSSDLLGFGGNFGAATIDDFVAGTGATHDTVQFATSDFASYAALRARCRSPGPTS